MPETDSYNWSPSERPDPRIWHTGPSRSQLSDAFISALKSDAVPDDGAVDALLAFLIPLDKEYQQAGVHCLPMSRVIYTNSLYKLIRKCLATLSVDPGFFLIIQFIAGVAVAAIYMYNMQTDAEWEFGVNVIQLLLGVLAAVLVCFQPYRWAMQALFSYNGSVTAIAPEI